MHFRLAGDYFTLLKKMPPLGVDLYLSHREKFFHCGSLKVKIQVMVKLQLARYRIKQTDK